MGRDRCLRHTAVALTIPISNLVVASRDRVCNIRCSEWLRRSLVRRRNPLAVDVPWVARSNVSR